MKLIDIQEAKTPNRIASVQKRYTYLANTARLKDFKPRINFFSDVRAKFRVLISGAYQDEVKNDNGEWSDSLVQQFAKDFAEEHGIPYTDFQIAWPNHRVSGDPSWYIFSIEYNFY